MNANKLYICMAGLLMPLASMAQNTTICDFESADSYKSVGVYDTWEHSPFRDGTLKGNAQVVDNHLTDVDEALGFAPNESAKILGVQRSRFGSNTFGALVELAQPFALTRATQYVHVKMYVPVDSKVMLIGLGNRDDRPWQSDKTEQFWSTPSSQVTANRWNDIVFAVSGADGITVRNLLVVVDRTSPHALAADYAAYVDDIILSASSDPFFSTKFYPLNYEETQATTRDDRYLSSFSLTTSDGTQSVSVSQNTEKLLYINKMHQTLKAKPGDMVTPTVNWNGSWMCGYFYIDLGNDGKFNVDYTDSGITAMRDLMSYSYFKGTTSDGVSVSGSPSATPPSFEIPENQEPGFYRLRYKVDWDNVDAGGNPGPSNKITDNGGAIVDVRINIHNDNVNLYRATEENGGGLNGEIVLGSGVPVTDQTTAFGKSFTIKAVPAAGFVFDYVKIRHGYNLEGPSTVCDNLQWEESIVSADKFVNGTYTVPSNMVDGDIRFVPYFKSDGTSAVEGVKDIDEALSISSEKGGILVKANSAQQLTIVDALGHVVYNDVINGVNNIPLTSGVYIANNKKIIVK